MREFDVKQKKIIIGWHKFSENSDDAYFSFMAEWIAFNAICYNLYYEKAIKERTNINRKKSKLESIHQKLNQIDIDELSGTTIIKGTVENWSIDINLPEKLFITVSHNYTEDIIYNEFVNENKNEIELIHDTFFEQLKYALKKKNRSYVKNMAKSKKYCEDYDIEEMAQKNIIILCEQNNLKTVKDVLYQIRCNIFHGEKIPGDLNDDQIVKSAYPLLKFIVNYMIEKHNIKK